MDLLPDMFQCHHFPEHTSLLSWWCLHNSFCTAHCWSDWLPAGLGQGRCLLHWLSCPSPPHTDWSFQVGSRDILLVANMLVWCGQCSWSTCHVAIWPMTHHWQYSLDHSQDAQWRWWCRWFYVQLQCHTSCEHQDKHRNLWLLRSTFKNWHKL